MAERRKFLAGFVYSPLRIGDLMHGIFGVGQPDLDFVLYDGTTQRAENRMYQTSRPEDNGARLGAPWFRGTRTLDIGGRTWTIAYHSNANFDKTMSSAAGRAYLPQRR